MISDRKSEKSTFISIDKKPSELTSEISSESRRLFTSGSWKKWKTKPVQLFHTCTRNLHQSFVTFRTCREKWKLIMLLKQKRKRFVKEISEKWKMDHFELIWRCIFSIEMKTTFWSFFQNLVPNSNLRPLLAELEIHAPAWLTERHHPPAGPASTQEILIPCAGVAPPLQYTVNTNETHR